MATPNEQKAEELRDKAYKAKEAANKKLTAYLASSSQDDADEWCAARQEWLDAQKEYEEFLRSQAE